MSIIERPIVIGVFKKEMQARSAVDVLREAGFSGEQIRIAIPGGELMAQHVFDDLINMGVSEEEASYCQHEFEGGYTIILVRHDGRLWEAMNILYGGQIPQYLKRLEFRKEAFQASLVAVERTNADGVPVWRSLLIGAGLEHIFDSL